MTGSRHSPPVVLSGPGASDTDAFPAGTALCAFPERGRACDADEDSSVDSRDRRMRRAGADTEDHRTRSFALEAAPTSLPAFHYPQLRGRQIPHGIAISRQ